MSNEYYRNINNETYHGNRNCPELKKETKTGNALLVYKSKPSKYTPCDCTKKKKKAPVK